MDGYTHMLIGGLSAGIPLAVSIAEKHLGINAGGHYFYPLIGALPAIIGSLGPDIDMPNSKSGKSIRTFLRFAITASGLAVLSLSIYLCIGETGLRIKNTLATCFVFFALICCVKLLIGVIKHRRETHSGLALLILLLPNIYIIRYTPINLLTNIIFSIWFGFCLGWVSHLLADSFNRKGVPWLYPLNHKHYYLTKIVTGSKQEYEFRRVSIYVFLALYMLIMVFGIYR
jgi:inner membrane protein